jgi:hypothetical protein
MSLLHSEIILRSQFLGKIETKFVNFIVMSSAASS